MPRCGMGEDRDPFSHLRQQFLNIGPINTLGTVSSRLRENVKLSEQLLAFQEQQARISQLGVLGNVAPLFNYKVPESTDQITRK
jgi:hypothetical protein